jgi:acyl-CoA synthetase (AMP-forming)/AMP-acid ligase II
MMNSGSNSATSNPAVSMPTRNGWVPTAAPRQSSGKFCLTQPLKRALQLKGDKTATIFGERQRTWSELNERVARLAGALHRLGVRPGERVAILALNSDRYLETYFTVSWSGGVIVPMNIRWAVPEHVYSLNDSGAIVLIVDDAFAKLTPQLQAGAPGVQCVVFAGEGATPPGMLAYEEVMAAAEPVEDALAGNDDLAGIFYTGGTTGFPKGVMLSHQAIYANGLASLHESGFTNESSYLHAAPMFHLADYAGSIATSVAGATHVFIPAFDPEQTIAAIARHRVTNVVLVPSMIGALMLHPAMEHADLSSLQCISYGASPISETLLTTALAKLPGCKFLQAYGQTELAPVATVLPPDYHVLSGPRSGKLRSAGRATYGVELQIVDPSGLEVPRGTIGEVIVRGPNTMLGYWNKPEETARALVDGWMHTGDAAYMDDDGFIYIVDRLKDMIVTGGENVYSVEVENAIASHPAVASCAVIGVPDEQWGERVHAVVVRKAGAQAGEADIIAHCRQLIATYKCPSRVSFQDSLPLSGAGKVLKRQLREPYWEGMERRVN